MTLPTRQQQISTVAKFLDSDRNEGRDLEDIARDIVDGYLGALVRDIKKPAQPIRLGMLFKTPLDAKPRRVAWMDDQRVWYVTEDASYGYLGPLKADWWQFCEEYRPKRRTDGKMVEMSDEDIAEAWSNPDWKVGDRVSLGQRTGVYDIIATGPKCVLLSDIKTGSLMADDNRNLAKFYHREVKAREMIW